MEAPGRRAKKVYPAFVLTFYKECLAHHSPSRGLKLDEARLLCMACQKPRLDVVQWMCENSDDPQQLMNKQESWQLCRPMDFACMGGSVAVCELLESHGARVVIPEFELDLEVNGDETRMHMACRGGHLDVCKWLYDRGAHEYVCLEDPDSQTPLHCAAACGRLDLCQWLVKHGAAQCVNVVATYGMTPLAEACSSGNLDLCEWLVDECGALMQPTDAKLMAEAARRGHVPVMAWLCERGLGSTVTMETDENNTPLHHACGGHHLSAVEFLYNHGARQCITEPNSLDQTPLHKCCASPSRSSSPVCAGAEVAEWLCTHGAEECVHLGDRIGRTPLHVAYMQSSVDVCEALYRHGAIDTVSEHNNWRNWTPLSEDVRGWFVRRFGNSMSERALAVAFSSFMRGHAKLQMKVDRVRVRADQRADHGGGDDGSDEADLLQLQQREQRVTADALAVLELGGPCVVTQCVPVKASDAILGAAVRRGVPLQFLEPHPRLRGLVAEAVLCRSAFVSAFLFGCRKSSGSTCLWRIGSRYAMAGFRKDIAEYCGVVMDAAEWLRMKQAHFELLRPGSSASRLRRKRQQRH